MKTTTGKHLSAFRKEALFWIERFGLNDYECEFARIKLDNTRAQVTHNYLGKTAGFYLTSEWTCPMTPLNMTEVRKCAKHEVIELLIADLSTVGQSRFVTEDEMMSVRHTLVRRLEKLL